MLWRWRGTSWVLGSEGCFGWYWPCCVRRVCPASRRNAIAVEFRSFVPEVSAPSHSMKLQAYQTDDDGDIEYSTTTAPLRQHKQPWTHHAQPSWARSSRRPSVRDYHDPNGLRRRGRGGARTDNEVLIVRTMWPFYTAGMHYSIHPFTTKEVQCGVGRDGGHVSRGYRDWGLTWRLTGIIIAYGINSFAGVLANSTSFPPASSQHNTISARTYQIRIADEYKNDPRNPNPPKKH